MPKERKRHCSIRCVETGEVYESMIAAAAAVERSVSAISQAIQKNRVCAGYHWEKIPEKPYTVYKLTLPNGKIYIGETGLLLSQRWGGGYGYKNINKPLYNDIAAFGWENVEKEVLAKVDTAEEARALERQFILECDATNPERGYNVQTNLFSSGTPEEIAKHKREYNREYNNVTNPRKTVICVETGVEYENASDAARKLGLNPSHICAICRGDEGRHTCGGYHWEWGSVI